MTSYRNASIKKYLDDLAARKPTPGGGSAAALVGALGCGLLSMSCNFTIGKDKYKKVEDKVRGILSQTEYLRKRLLELVDLDVKAYYNVFKSRKKSGQAYQKNLIAATNVPLEICKLSISAYKLCPFLARISNKYLISDVYVARELLKSCFKSAKLNVKINLPAIKDKKFVKQANKIIIKLNKLL